MISELMLFKSLDMICLVILAYISFLTIKYSQIDKFGGGPEHPLEINRDINELKRKTIFKLITNFFIVVIMSITLIANILNPDVLTNQLTLVIFIAAIASLGIKLGIDLNK